MTRFLPVFFITATAACASTGTYAPQPFPTAGGAAARRPAPAAFPPASSAHAPVPAVTRPSGAPDRTALSSAVLATAMSLTGVPYRLGGADPSGFDCSGFVQYVFARHGIGMPRTAIEQFAVGVDSSDVEPGDLLFFQTVGSQASHVGIAVDATSFVHAPNSRGVVRVDRLASSYWRERFIGARRVF